MHEQFLLIALEQAWHGRGFCAPNPSVGAVAVQNGKIIAQAWHQRAGQPHAEQLVLNQLPKNLPDVTLYVTLEPCNHWGKTPPCVNAILDYGISKVVYAYHDLNPLVVANNTPNLLREHGIIVEYLPIPEIQAFYESYKHWMLTKRPFITAKIAQSLNGKIAGTNGERILLSNHLCQEFTHKQRLYSDLILTSSKTINNDDPLLNVRLNNEVVSKPVAIIDTHCKLNPQAKILTSATHCIVYHGAQYQPPSLKNCTFYPMPIVKEKMDLHALVQHLGGLGFHDVWVEAGGELFSALHQEKLVQKTYIYLTPKILENHTTPAYHYDIFNSFFSMQWETMGDNVVASVKWENPSSEETACLPVL